MRDDDVDREEGRYRLGMDSFRHQILNFLQKGRKDQQHHQMISDRCLNFNIIFYVDDIHSMINLEMLLIPEIIIS